MIIHLTSRHHSTGNFQRIAEVETTNCKICLRHNTRDKVSYYVHCSSDYERFKTKVFSQIPVNGFRASYLVEIP